MSSTNLIAKKEVLITGCSNGSIGAALAKEFHRRGFHVIATARSVTRLQELIPLGIQVEVLDVTSTASIEKLRSKVSSLTILFNNAGGLQTGMIADCSMQDWRSAMDQNFFSVVEVTQAFLPLILESKGTVVNHTSQSPFFAFPAIARYAVSKTAVQQYTNILRTEMHPFGVRVVELITGVTGSNMVKKQPLETPYVVPSGSIYTPIKTELEKALMLEDAARYSTDLNVYAKNVVSDLLDGGGWFSWAGYGKPWIWRGWTSTLSYFFWVTGCMWKGLWDPLWRRNNGLHLLRERLEKTKTH